MRTWSFAKGHGTGNDFVLLLDRTGTLQADPATVRYLCDRHIGVGGDGLIRAVPARYVDDWSGDDEAWFMDYRNADGSLAEMCGNGVRVFVRYLLDRGLSTGPELSIGTRSGPRQASVRPDGSIRAEIGPVRLGPNDADVGYATASGPVHARGTCLDVGNPHVVVRVADLETLAGLDLGRSPQLDPQAFPNGANVEFVVAGDHAVAMRVYERGVGETRSCGTGTVAAAAAVATDPGGSWAVDVPGGRLHVDLPEKDGEPAWLTGPAIIVAHGEVSVP